MGKALALFVVAVATALLVYGLVGPLLNRSSAPPAPLHADGPGVSPASEASQGDSASGNRAPPASNADITAPLPSAQRERLDLEAKRAPYYRSVLHASDGDVLDVAAADDDRSILVLYIAHDDTDLVASLVQNVVAPDAHHYGFVHARIFAPNPSGSVERYRLVAEADAGDGSNWNTFLK